MRKLTKDQMKMVSGGDYVCTSWQYVPYSNGQYVCTAGYYRPTPVCTSTWISTGYNQGYYTQVCK